VRQSRGQCGCRCRRAGTPAHERRYAEVVRIAAQARQDVRTGGQLGHVEILRMIDAREKLLRPQRKEVDVTSLDRHTTAHDRIEPIVGTTSEADLKLGHLGKPPASVLHRGLARISLQVSRSDHPLHATRV
jgi:hypothetical protein